MVSGLVQVSGTFVCCYLAFRKIKFVKEIEVKCLAEKLSAFGDEINAEILKLSGLEQEMDADTRKKVEKVRENLDMMEKRVVQMPISASVPIYYQFFIVFFAFKSLVVAAFLSGVTHAVFCSK